MNLTPDELAELGRLAEAATPGPWEAFAMDSGHSKYGLTCAVITEARGDSVCEFDALGRMDNERDGKDDGYHDSRFIAAFNPETAKTLLGMLAEKDVEILDAQAAAVRGYAVALDDTARDLTTNQRLVPGLVLAKKIAERTADAISRGELS